MTELSRTPPESTADATVDTAIRSLALGDDREPGTSGDRREQIYFHAAQLFLEKGFAATSMSDIARAVGITKAGIYHFVSDKEELLFTLMSWGMAILRADVVEPAQDIAEPLERLEFVVRAHLLNIARGSSFDRPGNPLTVILDEPAGLRPEKRSAINNEKREYFDFVRSILVELHDRGDLMEGDLSVATFSLLGMVVWFGRWYRPSATTNGETTVAQITRMVLRSVVRPEALQRRTS